MLGRWEPVCTNKTPTHTHRTNHRSILLLQVSSCKLLMPTIKVEHTALTPHGSYISLPANPATCQAHSGSRVYALVLCTWVLLPSSQPFAQLKYLSYELPLNGFSSGMSRSDQPLKLQSFKLCLAFLAVCTATWNATVWVFSLSFSFPPEWKLQRISTLCPGTGNDCSVQ